METDAVSAADVHSKQALDSLPPY